MREADGLHIMTVVVVSVQYREERESVDGCDVGSRRVRKYSHVRLLFLAVKVRYLCSLAR